MLVGSASGTAFVLYKLQLSRANIRLLGVLPFFWAFFLARRLRALATAGGTGLQRSRQAICCLGPIRTGISKLPCLGARLRNGSSSNGTTCPSRSCTLSVTCDCKRDT